MAETSKMIENHVSVIQSSLGNPAGMIGKRYYDIIHGTVSEEPKERDAEEVKDRFINAFKEN